MKHVAFAAALLLAGLAPALAQTQPAPPPPYTSVFPPDSRTGQNQGNVRADAWYANTSTAGFGQRSLSSIAAAGTTQATATDIVTSTTIITACPAGAGVQLPNLEAAQPVVVLNRSGASCLVYPTPNGTVETAPGTVGAVNAAASIANNADVTFRMTSPTSWVQ